MKKYAIIWMVFILPIGLTSCSNWLDVKPKKTVEEEELFSREIGFKEALTALYIKMASTNLYARNLIYGFLDILGQRYQPVGSQTDANPFQDPLYYTFPSVRTESTTTVIWNEMYNIIANVNNLLYWMDKNKNVFTTPGYYEIIKGEALGLRAFLHFDLLRMYGPIYKENPDALSISYRTLFTREAKEVLPARVVADSIVTDLKRAEQLLEDTDPLLFDFPQSEDAEEYEMEGDRFLVYRHKRMNLYAVKAMLARVYLYSDNKDQAAEYARKVIAGKQFEFISDNTKDRLFSKEIIFSIYIDKFADQASEDLTTYGDYVITDLNFLDEIFDVDNDGGNDIRMREGVGFDIDIVSAAFRKFRQEGMWASTESTIPLIRLPEMYYILAECTKDNTTSAGYLNMVRDARGVDETAYSTPEKRLLEIEKEYRKEFYGEGQLFFFYKRNFYNNFLHCPVPVLTEKNYTFNFPEDEELFGKTN